MILAAIAGAGETGTADSVALSELEVLPILPKAETELMLENSSGDNGQWAVYHRLESPTQSPEVALEQEQSGEIWGRTPWGGIRPAVQAYSGPLPEGARGIEFMTDVPPDPYSRPHEVRWSHYNGPRPGVEVDAGEGFAKIKVKVTKNTQH